MSEYTGGSVSYYTVDVKHPTNPDLPAYQAECNDIIEALGMNYAEGNAFKALWRRAAAKNLGMAKRGYTDGLYDAEKVVFFGGRMVAQENYSALKAEALASADHVVMQMTQEGSIDLSSRMRETIMDAATALDMPDNPGEPNTALMGILATDSGKPDWIPWAGIGSCPLQEGDRCELRFGDGTEILADDPPTAFAWNLEDVGCRENMVIAYRLIKEPRP